MKIRIDEDEWYPVFSITDSTYCSKEIEATEDEIKRWKEATEAFKQMQNEIDERLK